MPSNNQGCRVREMCLYVLVTIVGMILLVPKVSAESVSQPIPTSSQAASFANTSSAELNRHQDEARRELECRLYGASENRLQNRGSDSQEIELAGTWQMAGRDADTTEPFGFGKHRALPKMDHWEWHEVSVPGSIPSGLLEAGVIQDPYWNDNAGKSLWTEKKEWWFKKSVVVPREWSGRRVFLGFDGVDYYSSVWFNGVYLGDHEGMYGGPVIDMTPFVHIGKANDVVVKIHPGGTDEPGTVFKGYIFMKWHYLTDLSPRGIWRNARLVATGPVRLENPFVQVLSVSEDEAELQITADIYNPGEATEILINGMIVGENFAGDQQAFSVPVRLSEKDNVFTSPLRVVYPRLWWPIGMGEPNLYRLTLAVQANGNSSDNISTVFGIRTLQFESNPEAVPTSSGAGAQTVAPPGTKLDLAAASAVNNRFMCRINGRLISLRGAGGFGAHDYLYRFHNRKDAWVIKVAQAMNFNFIRIHAAGIIATDEFYDLCDRMGMMVWQDFMISNTGLSGLLHREVWRTQAVQSILRLRNHPSLIYWCGGNEFNPDNSGDATKRTVDMLAESVGKYDGTRPFSRAAQYVNDPHYNDQSGFYGGKKIAACSEYAGVWAGNILSKRSLRKFLPEEDVERWPPVTKDTLESYLPASALTDWDNSRRGAFVFHTALTGRLSSWLGDLMVVLPQWILFGIPRTMDQAFEISQVCGGYTTSYTMETFRSRWPCPSLYASWDFAPIWPMSLIWGPMDYYGVVLPCAYYYKRALEPLHILIQMDPKEHIKVPVIPIDGFPKIFAPGDTFRGRVYVVSDLRNPVGEHAAEIQIFGEDLSLLHEETRKMSGLETGPASLFLGSIDWGIPLSMPDQTALVCISLKDLQGKVMSRSGYPIWISHRSDDLIKRVDARRDQGPWLTEMKKASTKLQITPIKKTVNFTGRDYLPNGTQGCAKAVIEVKNVGEKPAFHTGIEISNADCRYFCEDNYFILMPKEKKRVTIEIDRSIEPFNQCVKSGLIQPVGGELQFTVNAWNAPAVTTTVLVDE